MRYLTQTENLGCLFHDFKLSPSEYDPTPFLYTLTNIKSIEM